ncbi:hypothetical protein ACADC178_1095 [Lactobacillus delbrueckii subsp. lactis]|nr:hypothetical protein ACADC178_1095 [Lactobacillus delbrueckii subsp. lactis]
MYDNAFTSFFGRINDNLVQQLSVGFEKLYSDLRHTKTFA